MERLTQENELVAWLVKKKNFANSENVKSLQLASWLACWLTDFIKAEREKESARKVVGSQKFALKFTVKFSLV